MPPLAHALAVAKATGRVVAFLEHGPPMVELLHEAVRREVEAGYARHILAAFEAQGRVEKRQTQQRLPLKEMPSAQAGLVEPLSERELQVLRLLQSPLSQPEIAEQLYVSINTIRSHASHIYSKLGVRSRIAAVARAEELGLL